MNRLLTGMMIVGLSTGAIFMAHADDGARDDAEKSGSPILLETPNGEKLTVTVPKDDVGKLKGLRKGDSLKLFMDAPRDDDPVTQ